jgi:hypothetical protein
MPRTSVIRAGFPPIAVRPENRPACVLALQQAPTDQGAENFKGLLYQRLNATLGELLEHFEARRTSPEAVIAG